MPRVWEESRRNMRKERAFQIKTPSGWKIAGYGKESRKMYRISVA